MKNYKLPSTGGLYKNLFLISAFIVMFGSGEVLAQLSGTYTINPANSASSTNYKTFGDAVSDMISGTRSDGGTANGPKVSGAVTFNVANGKYSEKVLIGKIKGASATNTVTFQSASGDSSKVKLVSASSTTSTNNYTLSLDGADYLIFKKITIIRTGTDTYGKVVDIDKLARSNQFLNCRIMGIIATSTSTNNALIYSGSGNQDTGNVFRNNLLKYGSYGFYFYGKGSADLEPGTVIENNILDSIQSYGIRLYYQNAPVVKGNIITNMRNSSPDGIYMGYCDNNMVVMNNQIYHPGSGNGIYIYYCDGVTGARGLTANNMVSIGGTGTTYGIYMSSASNQDIVYNSILTSSTGTTTRAIYGTGTATKGNALFNNIFMNTGGGYSLYSAATDMIDTSDHNVFYTSGTNLIFYKSTAYTSLGAYQTASAEDVNSFVANIKFKSSTDLHTNAVSLNGTGTPFASVTTDIDGTTRSLTTPDIGADEFVPPSVDAALTKIISPTFPSCNATETLTVQLKNTGLDPLDSVYITYLINGVQQDRKRFDINLPSGKDTALVAGTFAANSTLKNLTVYVSDPNGVPDPTNTNDTLKTTVRTGLSGTFTIGTSGDYASFSAAISALYTYGICGPIVFNVSSGTYYEQLVINAIPGASLSNTVTFQSATGDSTTVTITTPSYTTSTENYTLQINGADYLIFKNMTFERSGTNTYGRVIDILGGSENVMFLNNRILGVITTSTSSNLVLIYSNDDNDNNNVFRNNLLKYGSYGFYIYGTSSSNLESGTVIEGNIIDSTSYYGIRVYYQNAPKILNNTITNITNSTAYGIYTGYSDNGLEVSGNRVLVSPSGYGIYLYYSDATSTTKALVANNMVRIGNTSSTYGIYISSTTYADIVYNSVMVKSTSTTNRGIYSTGTATKGITLYNNIFSAPTNGYAMYLGDVLDTSDHNILFSGGTDLVYWNSSAYSSLSAYQSASGMDPKSVVADPEFPSSGDLVTSVLGINGKGTPISTVTTDIYGKTRSLSAPDPGAAEFTPPAKDIMLVSIISPVSGDCGDVNLPLTIVIRNTGEFGQSNFGLGAVISGSLNQTISETYSKTLASGGIDTFTFAKNLLVSASGGTLNITAYSSLSGDEDLTNDTIKTTLPIWETPSKPTVTGGSNCGAGTVDLIASSAKKSKILWYDSLNSTTPVASGDTFTTPVISKSKTYYASSIGLNGTSLGPDSYLDVSSTGAYNIFTNSMIFDVSREIILDSVRVFGNDTGTLVIEILDASNNVVGFATDSIYGLSQGEYVTLNINVKPGTGYQMKLRSSAVNLWRNSAGASYPYSGNSVSITGTSNSSYYYYFYNWHYSVYSCETEKVSVLAEILPGMGGAAAAKGSPFSGSFNKGTKADPDSICAGVKSVYELVPPTGYSYLDYGSRWEIKSFEFQTASGTPAEDTAIIAPTLFSNAKLAFTPKTTLGDSTFIIHLTITNLKTGCDSLVTRYIYVSPQPVAKFTAPNVCDGNAVNFSDSSFAPAGSIYSWTFGDGNTSGSKAPSHVYADSGSYNVELTLKNALGCVSTASSIVEVFPAPVAGFSTLVACEGDKTTFTNTTVGGNVDFKWTFGDGNTSIMRNPENAYATKGNYGVKLLVVTAKGCADSAFGLVNVPGNPVASFMTSNVCDGNKVIFTNNSTSDTTLAYAWDFGDGNTDTAANPENLYSAPGNYPVSLKVISARGCMDSITVPVTVFENPRASFTTTDVCLDEISSFNNTTVSGSTTDYIWAFGDGDSSFTENPTHRYTSPGTYKVILLALTTDGCSNTFNQDVVVNNLPEADFTAERNCLGEPTHFFNTSLSIDSLSNFVWLFGDGNSSNDPNPVNLYTNPGTYVTNLKVTTEFGCSDTISMSVKVLPLPDAQFSFSTDNREVVFTPADTMNSGYFWTFGDGDSSQLKKPVHTYQADGTYSVNLRVVSSDGCSFESTDNVTVKFVGLKDGVKANLISNAYPNPFVTGFNLEITLQEASAVRIRIYDVKGVEMGTVEEANQRPGTYLYNISADEYNLMPGTYFVILTTNDKVSRHTVVKVR